MFTLQTGHEGPEREQSYNSTLSLTSVLDGGGRSTPCPRPFTAGNRPSTHLQDGGWAPGFDPRAFHLMASRYTDYATSAHLRISNEINYY